MSAVPNAGDKFVSGRNQGGSLSIKAASIVSPGFEDYSASSRVHTSAPTRNAGPLGNGNLKAEVSVNGKAGLGGTDPLKELASSVESKFALLTHPPTPPGSKMGFPHSSGEEKDSPESPFEVIADKLELDKEFQDVLASNGSTIGSNWAKHGEREVLTDIPEDGICEFRAKPRSGGRISSAPGLTRQSSGTNAALEEISKCVREMHSFTSELLNWDLIPKDTEDEADASVNSRCSASPSQETNADHAGLKAGKREVEKTPGPPQPVTVSLHPKNRLKNPVVSPEAGVVKIPAAPGEPKSGVGWPNPGVPDAMDADSSGESDDTVIEDPVADLTSQNAKTPENTGTPIESIGSAKTEIVQARDEALKKMVGPHPEDQAPSKNLGPADDFLYKSVPDSPAEAGWELGVGGQDYVEEQASHEALRLSSTRACPSLPFSGVKQVGRPDVAKAGLATDSAKECLESEENDSPEDPVETFSEAELWAARSQGMAPSPDFEQERLTIKALKEVGRKTGMERQPSGPSQVFPPSGRPSMQYYSVPIEVPVPAQKSALEKRPLCLKEAVGVKLTPGPAAYRVHGGGVPHTSSPELSPQPPLPHLVKKVLAGFSVRDLIFWRDVKKSAAVFSTTLVLLLSLAAFSVISVISYLILALLSVTISFRVYKSVIQAVQKSEDGHPFKTYLDLDITLSSEAFHNYVSSAMVYVNRALKLIMRLFLVEDLVDSLKLAVVMWLMTYVGAIFNGITLLILGELLVFSVPVVYEKYKVQIDHYVGIAQEQFKSIMAKIQAKVPGVVKKKPE